MPTYAFRYVFTQGIINRLGIQTSANGDFMESVIDYEIEFQGKRSGPLSSVIKQSAGSDYFLDVLEVTPPPLYTGPFDHTSFRWAAEQYMRHLFGGPGSNAMFIVGRSARDITFENMTLVLRFTFDIPASKGWEPRED